jgi:arylsulfatase A-like enzyme
MGILDRIKAARRWCLLLWLTVFGTTGAPMLWAAPDAPADRPNILFILVDDLGKDWVGCYGGDIETPQVDRLASTGMRFLNAYCMPQCTPSRLTLLTGQYPFRHGWVNHWDVPRWGHGYYDWKSNPSLGTLMKSAGYATAIAGKWQVNDFRVHPDALQKHGFDEWLVWTGGESGNPPSDSRYWNPYFHTGGKSQTYVDKFGPDLETDFLINFMRKHRDQRMFLYYPMCLTHGPVVHTPLEPNATSPLDRHKAMMRYADHLLGRLLGALDELGLRKNTIVVWTTDNGSAMPGTLNGRKVPSGKAKTTELGVCVPYIVNCPGRVPSGVVTESLTDFTDLLPTFAELAGAELPRQFTFDGVSIASYLLGRTEDSPRKWMMAMGGENRARLTEVGVENEWYFRDRVLRDKRYKVYVGPDRQPQKLIDLESDPAEEKNILQVAEGPARDALDRLMQAANAFPAKDNELIYSPPQPAYVEVSAPSQTWKKGRPEK